MILYLDILTLNLSNVCTLGMPLVATPLTIKYGETQALHWRGGAILKYFSKL